jgi:hypothetical protein
VLDAFGRTVQLSFPIGGDVVFGLERFNEMFCMLLANVFDAKVIDCEAKGDGSSLVLPKAGRSFARGTPKRLEMLNKLFLRQSSCLRQAIHALVIGA